MKLGSRVTKAQLEDQVRQQEKTNASLETQLEKLRKELAETAKEPKEGEVVAVSPSETLQVHVYAAVELTESKKDSPHTLQVIKKGPKTTLQRTEGSKGKMISGTTEYVFETEDLVEGVQIFHDAHYRQPAAIQAKSERVKARRPSPEVKIEGSHELKLLPTDTDGVASATFGTTELEFFEKDLMSLRELLIKRLKVTQIEIAQQPTN